MSIFRRGMNRVERTGKQRVTELEQTEVHERRTIRQAISDSLGPLAMFDRVESPSTKMAVALNAKNGPTYGGTVSKAVVARRRAANKRARVARRAARR